MKNIEKRAWFGIGCPKSPAIPNTLTEHESRSPSGDKAVIYTCRQGYVMIDPATNGSSNGKIECRNKFEWSPYPFPTCVPRYSRYKIPSAFSTSGKTSSHWTNPTTVAAIITTHKFEAESHLDTPTSLTGQDSVAQKNEKTNIFPSAGPLMYIMVAVLLFLLGFSVVVIVVVFWINRNKWFLFTSRDPQPSLRRPTLPPPKIPSMNQSGGTDKSNTSKAVYTRVIEPGMEYQFDSSRSEHLYEEINCSQ